MIIRWSRFTQQMLTNLRTDKNCIKYNLKLHYSWDKCSWLVYYTFIFGAERLRFKIKPLSLNLETQFSVYTLSLGNLSKINSRYILNTLISTRIAIGIVPFVLERWVTWGGTVPNHHVERVCMLTAPVVRTTILWMSH